MSLAAIILAAGQSSRMGAFKPLLPWGKQTVIDACIQYLREGGVESIVVVVGHRGEDIRKHLASSSVQFAVNPDPSSQMNSSIRLGVEQLPEDCKATFLTPVDFPAVPSTIVGKLATEWAKGSRLVKPTYQERGGHPVLVDLSLSNELRSLKADVGLKGLFESHKSEVKRLEVDSPYVARDIDTWDDYRALYAEIFGVEPSEVPEDFSNEKRVGLI
jgi:molybdenum cofactor cytidylyltransferase